MPLIKSRPHRVNTVRHICRLKEPNRDTLVAYARFIGESVDYVLNQLIATTLAKDRDFIVWRDQDSELGSASTTDGRASEFARVTAPEDVA